MLVQFKGKNINEYLNTQCSKIRKKNAISKVQKYIFCIFKNGKKINLCARKKSENSILGILKLFSSAKIDFLPFLKMQIMLFCTFEIAFFSNFRAMCTI